MAHTLFARLFASRHADGLHADALYRLQPERWLEAQFRERMEEILPNLRADLVYTQVPALAGGDRGMLDLLTLDRDGRLVILELKADEDLHFLFKHSITGFASAPSTPIAAKTSTAPALAPSQPSSAWPTSAAQKFLKQIRA